MKLFSPIIFFFVLVSNIAFSNTNNDSSITTLISKPLYEKLFPHHNAIYSYENFITAANSFPTFANDGNISTRKKELAAFLANVAHETSGDWRKANEGYYVWGLFYTEELACTKGDCPQYNITGTSDYEPAEGKSYYGRGPIQLSYAYNYGLAGAELNLPLLAQPELVSNNGIIAFKTALWFWLRDQKPKPSCHDVICGKWQPTEDDIKNNRKAGFGMVINIINGGLECNTTDTLMTRRRNERIGFYKWFAGILKVEVGDDCDCVQMAYFGQ